MSPWPGFFITLAVIEVLRRSNGRRIGGGSPWPSILITFSLDLLNYKSNVAARRMARRVCYVVNFFVLYFKIAAAVITE